MSQLKQLKEDFTTNLRCLRETCSVFKCVVIIKILRSLQRTQFQELIKCHTKKLSRLISKDIDIDEHINNISSCHLSFFEKLILCRVLKFSLPQHCSSRDIQASFEKAFWRLDPLIKDPRKKELASATLRSIPLNYITKKGPTPPKALLRALKNLKRRDDIIISKPDKGSIKMYKSLNISAGTVLRKGKFETSAQQHFFMPFIFLREANLMQRSQIFPSSALFQQRYSS